jgi:hypothetical protein
MAGMVGRAGLAWAFSSVFPSPFLLFSSVLRALHKEAHEEYTGEVQRSCLWFGEPHRLISFHCS